MPEEACTEKLILKAYIQRRATEKSFSCRIINKCEQKCVLDDLSIFQCFQKAVSRSGVQRQCVRSDPNIYCNRNESGLRNYICNANACNSVTSSLRLLNPNVVILVAMTTSLLFSQRRFN
jgi:hypothetical protein